MRRHLVLASLLVVLESTSLPVFAWGPDGHRIIGEIASHLLTPRTQREVEELLEPGRFDDLAEVGNWADAYARRFEAYDWAAKLHYVDVDPAATGFEATRDCPRGECVIGAIERFSARLTDLSAPAWERREAFRFLVHFVEDVHQPLHVIHPDMQGGGRTPVVFDGEEGDLHELWDSALIERRLEDFETGRGVEPWQRFASELRQRIEVSERIAWAAEADPVVWAEEGIPASRALAFEVTPGQRIDEAYYQAAMPVIERRLQMAAVRLAAVLNRLLDSE